MAVITVHARERYFLRGPISDSTGGPFLSSANAFGDETGYEVSNSIKFLCFIEGVDHDWRKDEPNS